MRGIITVPNAVMRLDGILMIFSALSNKPTCDMEDIAPSMTLSNSLYMLYAIAGMKSISTGLILDLT